MVREAVAALRAEGLVVTRQGVGAFVAGEPAPAVPHPRGELRTLREVLEVMELRTGIEIEAAGLAAERATPADTAQDRRRLCGDRAAIARGEAAVDEDFAFHCRIAEATGNPQFLRFLDYLGRFIIPRQTIRVATGSTRERQAYLERIQSEHRDILQAIRPTRSPKARAAMRRHLLNSRKRYRKLAAELGD